MSFDVFDSPENLVENVIGFFIHFLPGLYIGLVLLFVKHRKTRSVFLLILGIFLFFLFNPINNISQQWPIILLIVIPIIISAFVKV